MNDAQLTIKTQVVDVPNVGPMFRRSYVTPDGDEVYVEYMKVVFGELPLAAADAAPAAAHAIRG